MLLLTTVRVSEHINRESEGKKHLLAEYVDVDSMYGCWIELRFKSKFNFLVIIILVQKVIFLLFDVIFT